jgi:hypothetical protein
MYKDPCATYKGPPAAYTNTYMYIVASPLPITYVWTPCHLLLPPLLIFAAASSDGRILIFPRRARTGEEMPDLSLSLTLLGRG